MLGHRFGKQGLLGEKDVCVLSVCPNQTGYSYNPENLEISPTDESRACTLRFLGKTGEILRVRDRLNVFY
jgi:hypothetical protein